jgi:two-component system NtrC family response regulator
MLERAAILAGREPIGPAHFPALAQRPERAEGPSGSWIPEIPDQGLSLVALEKALLLKALEKAGGNKSQAARLLGLTRRTLYSRMERHGLSVGHGEAEAS